MILNKFATGIVATAIGLTAISAPAKANDDIGKLLALLAGGYVVSEIIKDKKEDKQVAKREKTHRDTGYTHRHKDGTWHTHKSYEHAKRYHDKHDRAEEKKRKTVRAAPNPRKVIPAQNRLAKLPLPKSCRRTIQLRNSKSIRAMSKRCLHKHHYRISNNGTVTHRRYPSMYRRPNLIN